MKTRHVALLKYDFNNIYFISIIFFFKVIVVVHNKALALDCIIWVYLNYSDHLLNINCN